MIRQGAENIQRLADVREFGVGCGKLGLDGGQQVVLGRGLQQGGVAGRGLAKPGFRRLGEDLPFGLRMRQRQANRQPEGGGGETGQPEDTNETLTHGRKIVRAG